MNRKTTSLRALAALALLALIAGCRPLPSAEPPASPCAAAVARMPIRLIVGAGSPRIICENHAGPAGSGEAGWNDPHGVIHIDASTTHGYAPARYFAAVVAHELGHAWSRHQGFSFWPYADIRGLPHDLFLDQEDYAETFSYAAGFWMPLGPPPYAFQNVAGRPTVKQIARLRAEGLLPQ